MKTQRLPHGVGWASVVIGIAHMI